MERSLKERKMVVIADSFDSSVSHLYSIIVLFLSICRIEKEMLLFKSINISHLFHTSETWGITFYSKLSEAYELQAGNLHFWEQAFTSACILWMLVTVDLSSTEIYFKYTWL